MAKKTYVGVNNIARNVSKMYVGVNGHAKKIKKAYVGVNGVARQFWSGGYKTMTVIIDQSNSNPSTCCTYADDAVGMAAGSSSWDEFFGHYPCQLDWNGNEVVKVNRHNFNEDINGNTIYPDTSQSNMMVAFPRLGLKITAQSPYLYISMTNNPHAESQGFEYNAHTKNGVDKSKFYVGTYLGDVITTTGGTKLCSHLSRILPTFNKTISEFRTIANNSGYEQLAYYQLVFMQAMYILKYKNLDSQSVIGKGITEDTDRRAVGGSEAYGMDSEIIRNFYPSYMADGKHHVKLFGIEDFWGNVYSWIDGIYVTSNRHILTANGNYNDSGQGYYDNGQGATSNLNGYISSVQGTTKTGFLGKGFSGSQTTYFTDYGYLNANCVSIFGGSYAYKEGAGIFAFMPCYASTYSGQNVTARLMYL